MSIGAIRAGLKSLRRQRREVEGNPYWELVKLAAGGENVDLWDLDAALQAAGKTDDDFQSDVETQVQRRQLAERLKDREKLRRESAKIRQQQQTTDDQFRAARDEYLSTKAKLADQLAGVELRLAQANRAEGELVRTCQDPELLRQQSELESQRAEAVGVERSLRLDLWGNGRPGTLEAPGTGTTGDRWLGFLTRLNSASALLESGQARHRDLFVESPHKLHAKAKGGFAGWLSPRSPDWRESAQVPHENDREIFSRDFARFDAFYTNEAAPKVAKWCEALEAIERLNAELDKCRQEMLKP